MAVDMTGSVAAMITGCERFILQNPKHRGTIGFLITSDKEGPATNGTIKVIEHLEQQNIKIDFCIAGKPSSRVRLYDTIKNGRRGSLNGYLTIHCVQETHRLSPTGKHLLGACPRIDILIKIEVL